MTRRLAVLVLGGLTLAAVFLPEFRSRPAASLGTAVVAAQEPAEPPAGVFIYGGGPVRGKRAVTQTAPTAVGAVGVWVSIPAAAISIAVPAGTSDLFNVSFSAECTKGGGGSARIRILDTATGLPVEPYDGAQSFCAIAVPQTHTGTWVRRMPAGAHNLVVQVLNTAGTVTIDDWTFEVVVYD